MKRRTILTSSVSIAATAVASASTATDKSDELFRQAPKKKRAEVWMQQVKPAFAVAYFLGEADEKKDTRPPFDNDSLAKAASGKTQETLPTTQVLFCESGIDGSDQVLDVANLVARVRQRARVPLAKLLTLVEAVVQPEITAPIMECYMPHHIVICYDEIGRPCGAVEVCLTCNDRRMYPGGEIFRENGCDMVKVARVLEEVGLPLSGEKSLSIDEYAKEVAEQIRDVEKRREERGRGEQPRGQRK
jgi:hypothetical protein